MCCPAEIAACQRHLDDLKRQGTEDFPYVFDETRADRIIEFFTHLKQTRGVEQHKPIQLQPWQIFDLGSVYGWVHKDSGARRFQVTYNKRARGNFKSTEKSGQCLYHMTADAMYPPYKPELAAYENEPEVECAAVDRGQAMRVFGDAKKIAEASPAIAKRLIIPRSNPVRHKTRGGFMRALSKDTKNKDSGAPSYFVVDEYHAHPNSTIYDLGRNSFGKRAQALLDVITTAGDDAQSKPCYIEEEYARRILFDPSVKNERYFVMIRELPAGANPHDKSLWCMANPCLRYPNDYSKYLLDEIESEYAEAYDSNDPEKIRMFLTRRLCMWQTGSVNRYLDEKCMKLVRESMVDSAEFARLTDDRECYCGFDLGKRIDLSGVAAVFILEDKIAVKLHGFLPENACQRHEHSDRVPYRAWAEDGYVTLPPGDVTDNSYVNNWICQGEREHRWEVLEVDYDGHNATDLAIKMCEERNNEDFCVEISQTCAGQNLACKGFRELLLEDKVIIEYSALALWCFANAVEITNNYGDIKLSKKHKDDSERIDPVAAMMNALARALVRRNNPTLADRIESGTWGM